MSIKILKPNEYKPTKEDIIRICENALNEQKEEITKEILYLKEH